VKLTPGVRHFFDAVAMPIALCLIYTAFVITADATGTARILAGVFLGVVLLLWLAFRRLRVHAAAARLAAIGEPVELLALADHELSRRWLRNGDVALHVYQAMAYNLAARPVEARAALDQAGIKPGKRRGRSWQLLWGAADVDTRTQVGDAAGARKTFETIVVPFASVMPARGVNLMVAECEARVRLAEGDAKGARELVAPHVKDMRLGPGARAQLYAILSMCDTALGDEKSAAAAAAKARELAPKATLIREPKPASDAKIANDAKVDVEANPPPS